MGSRKPGAMVCVWGEGILQPQFQVIIRKINTTWSTRHWPVDMVDINTRGAPNKKEVMYELLNLETAMGRCFFGGIFNCGLKRFLHLHLKSSPL